MKWNVFHEEFGIVPGMDENMIFYYFYGGIIEIWIFLRKDWEMELVVLIYNIDLDLIERCCLVARL